MVNKENMEKFYKEYINIGGKVSPFNTELCRKYLEEKAGEKITHEDVLWLFYHAN